MDSEQATNPAHSMRTVYSNDVKSLTEKMALEVKDLRTRALKRGQRSLAYVIYHLDII